MKPALLHAMRRVDTIWGIAILAGMGNALVMAVRAFGQGPALLHPGLGPASEYSGPAVFAMLAFLVPTGIGMLANGALLETSSCAFTWALPGFRRAVRRDALVLFVLGCLPALLVLATMDTSNLPAAASGTSAPLWSLLALPPLGFAVGLVIFDPRRNGTLRLVSAAAMLLTVPFIEHVLLLGPLASLVATAAAALVFAASLKRLTSAELHQQLLLGGDTALPQGNRHPFAPEPWERAERRGKLGDRRWNGGVDAFREDPHRVVEFERWGWSRGTWPIGKVGPAGLILVLVVVTTFLLAQRVLLDGGQALQLFLGLTWNPRLVSGLSAGDNHVLHMVLPMTLFLVFLSVGDRMQPALRPGSLYPLSRSARARLYWRGGLRNWTRAVLTSTLFIAVAAAAVALATGTGFGDNYTTLGDGPPYWLTCALACAALLPMLQLGASLRELYPGEKLAPWKALVTMICMASCFISVLLIVSVNLAELHAFERWCALLVAPVLVIAGQLGWRAYLNKKLATMDLA